MPGEVPLARLIAALSRPEAWGGRAPVEVIQTHASVVFLVGDDVYKVKKPVDFGFLDYTDPARRAFFCAEEVRLNRRLAPDVYLGVVRVTEDDGRLVLEGRGPVVEHAVHMRRLPERATLRHALRAGALRADDLEPLGRFLARFHDAAARSDAAAAMASFDAVAANARDNVAALERAEGLAPGLIEELGERTEHELDVQAPRVRARAARGVACELHGDLRLEHVYRLPGRTPPDDLAILDGIEFNDAFRLGDPVSDVAFLVMDLAACGAWRHAGVLARAWLDARGEPDAAPLLPLYVSYRAAVRAKVAVLTARAAEAPPALRTEAQASARRHLQLAVQALRPPARRARLVLTAGLPGSGKTTLARALSERLDLEHVRTDVVRKQLAGLDETADAAAAPGEGLYTPAWTERTYAACLDRARARLAAGAPILVDGGFRDHATRARFEAEAIEAGVPYLVLVCTAPADELRRRLAARAGDASDADEAVLQHLAPTWEDPDPDHAAGIDTTADDAVDRAVAALLDDPF